MPVWHVSVSAWSRRTEKRVSVPQVCEREAVRLLRGVGGENEWWMWNAGALIGHLRVGVTEDEFEHLEPFQAVDDAGETGPRRSRTH
jgi:hypothetical protein